MNTQEFQQCLEKVAQKLENFDANKADKKSSVLNHMFDEVYASGVLDITHLNKEIQDEYKLDLFIVLSKYSGTLAFLIIQILAAHNIMTKNRFPKLEYYKKQHCGIAINHLRAPTTHVWAEKVEDGYELTGKMTWVSGYEIFDSLCVGFHYDDFEYEVMCPFENTDGFTVLETDKTFVGFGLNTVSISLDRFFVPDEDIVSCNELGSYTKQKSASKTVHFCILGLGMLALEYTTDSLKDIAKKKLLYYKKTILQSSEIEELDRLRIELFTFVQGLVTTAMIQVGGKSILADQTLQRVYRELIMFNSNGLNLNLKTLFKEQFIDHYK
jgi:hypothetical protein